MPLYWAMRLAFALTPRLPLSWRYRMGMWGGEMVYWCWPSKRRNTRRNMAVVTGDWTGRRAQAMARASLRNYGRYVVDFLSLPSMEPAEIVRRTHVQGWEHVDRALETGRGIIFVASHFGTYDFAPVVVADRYPGKMHLVIERFDSPLMDQMVQGQRAAKGAKIIPMTSVRKMVRVLRDNNILALLVDRPVHGDGVEVTFFGRPTLVPAGAATLAALTGATIIPGYIVQRDDGEYDGQIMPALEFSSSGDRATDVKRLTQRTFDAIERMIARSPQHWYMFRDMWPAAAAAREVEASV